MLERVVELGANESLVKMKSRKAILVFGFKQIAFKIIVQIYSHASLQELSYGCRTIDILINKHMAGYTGFHVRQAGSDKVRFR